MGGISLDGLAVIYTNPGRINETPDGKETKGANAETEASKKRDDCNYRSGGSAILDDLYRQLVKGLRGLARLPWSNLTPAMAKWQL